MSFACSRVSIWLLGKARGHRIFDEDSSFQSVLDLATLIHHLAKRLEGYKFIATSSL